MKKLLKGDMAEEGIDLSGLGSPVKLAISFQQIRRREVNLYTVKKCNLPFQNLR